MAKITSNARQVGKQLRTGVEKRVVDGTRRAMTKTALVGESRIKGIVQREAFDTGMLLRSINSVIDQLPNEMKMTIGTNLEYAYFIEFGRKPGKFPNLDALVGWTARKLKAQGINTRVNVSFSQLQDLARTGGKRATKQQQAYRAHLSAIYLIGRKIATKGIEQKLIFTRVQNGLLRFFRNELIKQL